ncbi:MAG: hypothetical protein ABI036_09360 [Fibrobacteria bacterium]
MVGKNPRSALVVLILSAFAVGTVLAEQSASFLWQATQGFALQGNAEVVVEHIDITIQPDHLDVEHELEIVTRSGWDNPGYPNSLEILGNLQMAKGTVITGFLLWNGNTILKGKLQTKIKGRGLYEEVVDRNVKDPPRPRDPAILEKTGENSYALSIFPVSLYGSRKLRFRYLIPSSFQDGAHRIPFPHAFSGLASVSVKGGPGTLGYAFTSVRANGTETTVKNEDAVSTSLKLDPEAYQQFRPYVYWGAAGSGAWLRHITPLFGGAEGSHVCLGSMKDAKGTEGHLAHFVFRPPADFTDLSPGPRIRIVALVTAGADSVEKEINGAEPGRQGAEELRIFSRAELDESITWRIYTDDIITKESTEKPLIIDMEDGGQYARSFGSTPFYPLTKTMPPSLASAWGFIDSKYALLALEQDSLKSALASKYAKAGVPPLDPEDIFPEEGEPDSIPLSAWMIQKNLNRDDLLQPLALAAIGAPSGIRWVFRDGNVIVEIDKATLARGLRVSLHGMDGKLLKQWSADDLSQGRLAWSPREASYSAGICFIRIVSGSKAYSARIILR